MKANIAYLFASFLAVTLLSCSDDLEPLIMQEEMSATLDYRTVTDAQRALRPSMSTQSENGEQPDKKGQKGRDHRDNVDYYGNERLKIESPRELQVGDLYVTGYDEEKDEYLLKFYWGDEISDETKAMLTLAQIYVKFNRQGYGSLVSGKSSSPYPNYYAIGDTFSFPGDICWTCTDIQVNIHYRKGMYLSYFKSWTQSFESLMLQDYRYINRGK